MPLPVDMEGVADLVDSDWHQTVFPKGPDSEVAIVVAGCLFVPDQPGGDDGCDRHDGLPVYYLDEVLQLHEDVTLAGRGSVDVLYKIKEVFGGHIQPSESVWTYILGPRPGEFTRDQIMALWQGWSEQDQDLYAARRAWVLRHMGGEDSVRDEADRTWIASYAAGRNEINRKRRAK